MRLRIIATALAWLLPAVASAGGMQIEPGRWQFTATARMPMLPEPKTTTMTRCISEAEADPQAFIEDAQSCEISEVESDAVSMRWKMVCTGGGGRMVGESSYTSTGATVSGTTTMSLSANGHAFRIETRSEGRRLGPCE
jgi:hypothetical protein